MKNKVIRIQCSVLSFCLVFVFLCVPAFASSPLTELVGERNRAFIDSQLADSDALFSSTLPDGNVDCDSESVRSKALEITAGCSTDLDKVHAVHDWVAKNVYYDLDFYYGRTSVTPLKASDVLEYRYSVCQGYANLSTALLRAVGIPSKLVTGYALGLGTDAAWTQELITGARKRDENHAWNEAYVDGRWVMFDSTWDSANTLEHGIPTAGQDIFQTYFDITPEQLAENHKIVMIDENHNFVSRTYGFTFTVVSDKISITGLYNEALTTLIIPSAVCGKAVTEIANSAFKANTTISRVVLPETLTTIGRLSFLGCSALRSITLPGRITSVGQYAFGFDIVDYDDLTGMYSIRQMSDFTIYCSAGTAAFSYASDNGIVRQLVIEHTDTDADTETAVTTLTDELTMGLDFTLTQLESDAFSGFAAAYPGKGVNAYDISVTVCAGKLSDTTIKIKTPLPHGALSGTVKAYTVVNGNTVELPCEENDGMLTITSEGVERYYLVFDKFIPGDLDGDKLVTTSDARIALRAAAQLETLTAEQLQAAEVDGVEGISTSDARILLRVAAQLQTL